MKEIERLAEEWWVANREQVFSQSEAFEAGFRAARELAAAETQKLIYSLAPNPIIVYTVEKIRKLGEDELAEK